MMVGRVREIAPIHSWSRLMSNSADVADEEPLFFHFGATLRIFGVIDDLELISSRLGLAPTHTHRRGERRSASADPYKDDMWLYRVPVPKEAPLDLHIQTLWAHLKSHRTYLLELKRRLTVDVFCHYTTNAICAGFEVSHQSLEMFTDLEVPFGVSILA